MTEKDEAEERLEGEAHRGQEGGTGSGGGWRCTCLGTTEMKR